MTDQDHANAIHDAISALNAATTSAVQSGLTVEYNAFDEPRLDLGVTIVMMSASVSRTIERKE